MSLFENDEYQWRETFFILFAEEHRPSAKLVSQTLHKLNSRYRITQVQADEAGKFESLTLESPDDYAAMDVSFVSGEDVVEQTARLVSDLLKSARTPDQKAAARQLNQYRCRFDVLHFEQLVFVGRVEEADEDDLMDPGALLSVMEHITRLCHGVIVDPQANCIL